MAVNVASYVKNVGKSFGYVAVDAIKDLNPVITEIVDSNKEYAKIILSASKDIRGTAKRAANKVTETSAYKDVKDILGYTLEDLKTGKFYNQERSDKAMMSMAGMDDFNFDFDDDSFNFDFDDDSSGMSDDAKVDTANTDRTISSMNSVGELVADAVTSATAKSADYIVKNQMAANNALYQLNNKTLQQVVSGFGAVNTNLSGLAAMVKPMATHIENSQLFYTKTTEELQKQTKLLEAIVSNTGPAKKTERSKGRYSDVLFNFDGTLNTSEYLKMVSKNIKDSSIYSAFDMIKGMGSMGGEGSGIKSMLSSPISFFMSMLIPGLMPNNVKKSMEKFNSDIGKAISVGMRRIKNLESSSNPILSFIGEFFGIKDYTKLKVNTGNYEKGKVDFDGKTRKSIVEVIPTYLSNILSAITGNTPSIFDYDKGQFTTKDKAKKDFGELMSNTIMNEMRPVIDSLREYMKSNNSSSELITGKTNELVNIISEMIKNNDNYTNIGGKKFKDISKKYGGSDDLADLLSEAFKMKRKKGESVEFDSENGFANAKIAYSKRLEDIENSDSILKLLFNNSDFLESNGIAIGKGKSKVSKKAKSTIKKAKSKTQPKLVEIDKYDYNNLIDNIDEKKAELNNFDAIDYEDFEKLGEVEKKKYLDKLKGIGRTDKDTKKERTGFLGKVDKILNGIKDIYSKPFDVVAKIIGDADRNLYKIFFGQKDEKDDEKSLVGLIFKRTKDLFNNAEKWVKEKFNGFKDKIKDLLGFEKGESIKDIIVEGLFGTKAEDGKRYGGALGSLGRSVKDNLKSAGRWARDSLADVVGFDKIKGKFKNKKGQAYDGGMVKKTGMIAVSGGEIIIPSEYNPYWKGTNDKHVQNMQELTSINRFYGGFAEGKNMKVGAEISILKSMLKKQDESFIEEFIARFENSDKPGDKEKASRFRLALSILKAKNNSAEQWQKAKTFGSRVKNAYNSKNEKGEDNVVKQSFDKLFGGMKRTVEALTPDDENIEKTKGKISKLFEKVFPEMGVKDNVGGMITGALLGGGASILTGGVISPLLASSVGAAMGLTIKSKKVQEALFGEEDEEGNKKGGFFSKDVSNFLAKKFPDMTKGGLLGSLITTFTGFPGGPVSGFILGSAVKFASSNGKAMKYLFGDKEYGTNGILGDQDTLKTIKKRLPNIGAGALAGIAAGPFGIAGNLIFGSALGYMTGSQQFQEALFGKKNDDGKMEGGILGTIRDKVISPLIETGSTISHEITFQIKKMFNGASRKMFNMFKESIGIPLLTRLDNVLAKPLGKVIKGIGKAALTTVGLPATGIFKGITGLGKKIKNKQIRKGEASYMSAAERIKYRNDNLLGRDKTSKFDEFLANSTAEEIEGLNLGSLINSQKDAQLRATGKVHTFTRSLYNDNEGKYGVKYKEIKKISKMLKDGKSEEAEKYIDSLKISDEQKQNLLERFKNSNKEYQDELNGVNGISDEMKARIKDIQEKTGIKFTDKNMWKYQDLVKKEIETRKNGEGPTKEEKNEDLIVSNTTKISLFIEKIYNKLTGKPNKDEESSVEGDVTDKVLPESNGTKLEVDEAGNTSVDNNDKTQREENKKRNKFLESIYAIPLIGQGLSKMGDGFSSLKDKLFGNKEKKEESIFSKLIKSITGKDGLLGGLTSFFTDGKVGTALKAALPSITFGSALTGFILPAIGGGLIAAGLTGKLDEIGSKIGISGGGDKTTVNDKDGNDHTVKTDKHGNPIKNKNGQYIDVKTGKAFEIGEDSKFSVKGSYATETFQKKLIKNTVRGAVFGTGSVVGATAKWMAKSKGGQLAINGVARKGLSKAVFGAANAADDFGVSNGTMIADGLRQGLNAFKGVLAKIPVVKKFVPYFDDLAEKLAQSGIKNAASGAKSGLKKAASFLSSAVWVLRIADAVISFSTGYQDARTTFQVTDEPSTGQKIISGLIRALKNFIPVIGSLIPDKLIVDIFVNWLAPLIGMDVSELKDKQAAAIEEAHNAGFATVTDYLKTDKEHGGLGDYTWTEKIGNKVKSIKTNIKEKGGVFKGIKDKASSAFNTTKEKVGAAKDTIKENVKEQGVLKGLSTSMRELAPNSLGDMLAAVPDLLSFAKNGDPKGLITYTVKGEKDNAFTTAIKTGMFTTFKGLLITPTLMIGAGKAIGKAVNKIISSVKFTITNTIKANQEGQEIFLDKESTLSDYMNIDKYVKDDEGNPVGFVSRATIMSGRLLAIPFLFMKKLGKTIKDGFISQFEKIKSDVMEFGKDTTITSCKYVADGDIIGLWKEKTATQNSIIAPILKPIHLVEKLAVTTPTLISAIGHKIKEPVIDQLERIKDDFIEFGNDATIKSAKFIKDGDIVGLWKEKTASRYSLASSLLETAFFAEKLAITTPTLVSAVGHKIKDTIDGIIKAIKSTSATMTTSLDKIDDYKDNGDFFGLSQYMTTTLMGKSSDDEGNPLSGFQKGIVIGKGMILGIPTMVKFVGNGIKDTINTLVDNVKGNISKTKEALKKFGEFATSDDVDGNRSKNILDYDPQFSKADPLFGINSAIVGISKVIFSVIGILKDTGILDTVEKLVGGAKKIVEGAKDKVEDVKEKAKDVKEKAVDIKDTAISKVKDLGNSAYKKLQDLLGGGSFTSQVNNSINNQRYANGSIATKGCGPAVASMVTGQSLSDTAKFARNRGYETNGGTSADYFSDVFASRGIQSRYIPVSSNNGVGDIASNIAAGNPTVLLGQDGRNRSKANSPFGPGDHYVLATGMDRSGNVIVQDPESNRGNIKYSNKILNSVKLGIATGGYSGILNRYRGFIGGGWASPRDIYLADLGSFSTVTADEMNKWIASKRSDSPFNGHGDIFVEASKASGLDPRYILAHAAVESAWGTSNYARNRHNYFGIGAFDSNPDNAYTMGDGMRAGIIEGAKWIAKNYYNKGQKSIYKMRYNGGKHQYCTSTTWVNTIAGIMANGPKNSKLKVIDKEDPNTTATSNGNQLTISDTSSSYASSSESSSSSSSSSGNAFDLVSGIGKLIAMKAKQKWGSLAGMMGFNTGDESNTDATASAEATVSTTSSGDTGVADITVNGKSELGKKIASDATKYIGKPYVWGGNDLNTGVDCSGFTQQMMKKFGVTIPRSAAQQASALSNVKVDRKNASAGDLIYFHDTGDRSGVTHTGIMLNNNEFIHAKGSKYGIVTDNLDNKYYNAHLYSINRPQELQGAGSGLVGDFNLVREARNTINKRGNSNAFVQFKGGGSKQRDLENKVNRMIRGYAGAGSSDDVLIPLIKTIIELLTNVSDNSNKLDAIVELLSKSLGISANQIKSAESSQNKGISDTAKNLIDYVNSLARA